jgi:hypothetical protein
MFRKTLILLAVSVSVVVFTGASAAPFGEPLTIIKAVPSVTQSVQWRGGGWGWGAPVAGGLIAGAIIGGALAAPYGPGYYPGPGYYGGPGYGPPPGVAYGPAPVEGNAVAYCSGRDVPRDTSAHRCPSSKVSARLPP